MWNVFSVNDSRIFSTYVYIFKILKIVKLYLLLFWLAFVNVTHLGKGNFNQGITFIISNYLPRFGLLACLWCFLG